MLSADIESLALQLRHYRDSGLVLTADGVLLVAAVLIDLADQARALEEHGVAALPVPVPPPLSAEARRYAQALGRQRRRADLRLVGEGDAS